MVEVYLIPVFADNYIFAICNPETRKAVVVDPGDAVAVHLFLLQQKFELTHILNTHHHPDHVGGNLDLQIDLGCEIVGFGEDAERIPGITQHVSDGDELSLHGQTIQVFYVPGHTTGHIVYYFSDSGLLFCGDTLFAMGCGRLFEGTPEQMHTSLQKLAALPPETAVYCAHEYTQTNGQFALSVDPDNPDLIKRMNEVQVLRGEDQPTIPSNIALEKQTNPFLRPDAVGIRQTLGMESNSNVEVFAELRARRNQFRAA